MAWLPMYLVKEDLDKLSLWLSEEGDIALIESVAKGKWQAKDSFVIAADGRYCLFHKLSGPLPLLGATYHDPDQEIEDPFRGWQENRAGADPGCPYFGSGHLSVFWLNVRLKNKEVIGLSSFEWIGNHYAKIGMRAPDSAKKWWGRLGRWVRKRSINIPREGALDGKDKEIWTFDGAMLEIESGISRAANPF